MNSYSIRFDKILNLIRIGFQVNRNLNPIRIESQLPILLDLSLGGDIMKRDVENCAPSFFVQKVARCQGLAPLHFTYYSLLGLSYLNLIQFEIL